MSGDKHSDKVLTEAYRDKRYEEDLTKLYFEVLREIRKAETTPSIEYVRSAFAAANNFVTAVVFSKHHLPMFAKTVEPVIKDLRKVLYGDYRLPSVVAVTNKYNASVVLVRNKPELKNGMAVIEQIQEIVFLIKQWTYEQGLFLPKPIDRKFGLDALEETMAQ